MSSLELSLNHELHQKEKSKPNLKGLGTGSTREEPDN